uniref:Ankyrin n=1 Tax=Solibacter usitatus (strain Ellin6076) TaxID=234267 RepID=Q01QR9_SOLUE
MNFTRRTLFGIAPFACLQVRAADPAPALAPTFPAQPPELAREMVSVSHGNIQRVRELVKAQPALAKASWDWGFGDWETALGAASHVGNREIAELLIAAGAPPTLFSAAMLGQLDVVKALIAGNPGAQRIAGPHSISLLAHAKNGGEASKAVYQYLDSLGDAGAPPMAPLTEEQLNSIAGTYVFGDASNQRIEITIVRGQPQFTRSGAVARQLFHLGDLAFHPAGSRAVRITFSGNTLTVYDPGAVLTARKL